MNRFLAILHARKHKIVFKFLDGVLFDTYNKPKPNEMQIVQIENAELKEKIAT